MQRIGADRFGAVFCAVCAAATMAAACGGCGGSSAPEIGATAPGMVQAGGDFAASPGTGTGRMVFRIAWPAASAPVAPSRLIPEAAQSIEIRILDDKSKVIATRIVTRAEREVTIEKLPAKKLVNVLRAFPNVDATGVAQAEGRADVEIKPDETTAVSLTLASAIDRLLLSPPEGASVDEAGTLTLGVSPRNAASEVVLVRPNGFRFVSLSPEIATVDATGTVTGVMGGTAIIEVTEVESGKKSALAVAVNPTGRVVFSDIAGNVTGVDFVPQTFLVDAEDYTDSNDVQIPNISYAGYIYTSSSNYTPEGNTFQSLSRVLRATLPPDFAAGQTKDVTPSASNPYHVEYEEQRQQTGSPGTERRFQSGGGSVTFVRRVGDRYTLRFDNVRLEATSADGSVATGRFTINGAITFVDGNPNDDNTNSSD